MPLSGAQPSSSFKRGGRGGGRRGKGGGGKKGGGERPYDLGIFSLLSWEEGEKREKRRRRDDPRHVESVEDIFAVRRKKRGRKEEGRGAQEEEPS